MRRFLAFLVLTGLAVAGAVWLADRPGEVTIRWQGWRADTSVPVLLAVLALLLLALSVLIRLIRLVFGAPKRWLAALRLSRQRKGYAALSDGLAAAASGDAARAAKLARKADKLLHDPAITGLLSSQAARLSGDDHQLAERFRAMTERKETAFLGHQGLAELAVKAGDRTTARAEAAKAFDISPTAPDLSVLLLDLHMEAGAWAEAEQVARLARRHGSLSEADFTRRRALILLGRAEDSMAAGDEAQALDWAQDSRDADPQFTPAVALAADLLRRRGKGRKAASLLKSAFKTHAHPLLIAKWLTLGEGESALDRVKRLQDLSQANPASPEGHVALAEAALAAQLWGLARSHLEKALTQRPTRTVFQLLAQVERDERKDETAAHGWLMKAGTDSVPEPAWVCGGCGHHSPDFALCCPACGAAGRLEWT
ncbi:putative HemY protein [Paramagnetospirillum magnetotacticum MS-1]|uniref:Putative HemY protein n=1 Tax=Paramagnetospirillum magnetotacticum MS-1 TaxID=272627 RepID=A0A0C2U909_PARME|nr:heme biosynthesis HemY N-terminal domain-containing protein [Paramagnetospirillum magnetotacticum]KIL97977.1 putative HemY protein [Paramagnetospirillum magnetotacticum MS-1]